MNPYPNLFKKGKLGKITTKNRIVMSPMGDNMANTDGSVSEQSIAYYTERAKGGAGVIIPGVVSVDYPGGKTIACQHRLDSIKYVQGWERMARSIHRYGALLIPQIHHAGMSTDSAITEGLTPVRVSEENVAEADKIVEIGSSIDEKFVSDNILTIEDIKELEQKFIECAKFAQMATCDGVEIHGAHGYLISQFLTPYVNIRTDEYGGSLENRMRFAINIIRGIREACGQDFIIGIRMPVHSWDSDGLTDEDSKAMARAFEEAGCDFLDISGGFTPSITNLLETQKYDQGDRVELAEKIMGEVKIPVMAVGMLREPDFCEDVLNKGLADYVVLGRTLLADAYWPQKARAGKANEIRRCISCLDACFGALAKNQTIRCIVNPTVGYESELNHASEAIKPKNVVIIGGGIAGMQAAITASERGHKVTLLEKTDKLGGQLHIANVPPHKEYINWATDWYIDEINRNHINVKLGYKADVDSIKPFKPEAVFMATGAKPWTPSIPGIENGTQSWDILSGTVDIPKDKKVTIIGGGIVGCETALYLAEKGNKVTILEMQNDIAIDLEMANKIDMLADFKEMGIVVEAEAIVKEIQAQKVIYEKNGVQSIESDLIVLATGMQSSGGELADELEAAGYNLITIGDANKPSKIANATTEGFFAALNL